MWPRSCERGIFGGLLTGILKFGGLQCGRAHASAESKSGVECVKLQLPLQCGRAHASAESRLSQVLNFQRPLGRFASGSQSRPVLAAAHFLR